MKQTDSHPIYNTRAYPYFIASHGNWHIYANRNSYCAAIAVQNGCKSSNFGTVTYTDMMLRGRDIMRRYDAALLRERGQTCR